MKSEILTLLRETDSYISGQQLCEEMKVSRTAVWKVISQLREQGYEIEAVQNKGYRLVSTPDILSESEIRSRLHTKKIEEIKYFEETQTTNVEARRLLEMTTEKDGAQVLAVANMQTMGKGRRGRKWISPKGTMIAMSLGMKPSFAPEKAPMLTLLMGLSVCKAIRQTTGLEAMIKWPNDVVVNNKKVCGILTEMNAEMDYIDNVIIGTGINVNQATFDEEIKDMATSLYLETGHIQNRAEILCHCLEEFEELYDTFLQTLDMSEIMKEYNAYLINQNAKVRVLDPKGEYVGTAEGINEIGELLVKKEDGTMERVYAGEVSVRGLYGYAE